MTKQFAQIGTVSPGDVRIVGVDMRNELRRLKAETLTGTPTVVEIATTKLNPDNVSINSGDTIEVDSQLVPINQGIEFRVSVSASAVVGTTYYVLLTCQTSKGQTIKYQGALTCV